MADRPSPPASRAIRLTRASRLTRAGRLTRASRLALGLALVGLLSGCGGDAEQLAAPTGSSPTAQSGHDTPAATEMAPATSAPPDSAPGSHPPADDASATPTGRPPVGQPDLPTALAVEDIGDWELTALGVDEEGFINPPAGVVQWYDESPRPGQPGIAVIAGHVAWDGVPDAFARLGDAQTGAEVTVIDASGQELVFEVTEVRLADKDDLMSDPDVWGPADEPRLAIVTCDADSGTDAGGHFEGNLVVEAELVGVGL